MIITLTTDFGTRDGFVGVMKGVISGIRPGAASQGMIDCTIIDITHDIAPFDIEGGAWVLSNSFHWFPPGTIHMAVVDPGVGSSRRPILLFNDEYKFVGPDNGIFSYVMETDASWQAAALTENKFWRDDLSSTFHGRDIFAPVAAHLAGGEEPKSFGPIVPIEELVRLPMAIASSSQKGVVGRVIYVDVFGNLITNIPAQLIEARSECLIEGQSLGLLKQSYSDGTRRGEPVALVGSHGHLEISVFQGRADAVLNATRGATVTLQTHSEATV